MADARARIRDSVSWTVLDAATGSLLSLLLVVAATRIGGVEATGQLALMSTVVLTALGFFRLSVGVPYLKAASAGEAQAGRLITAVTVLPCAATLVTGVLLGVVLGSSLIVVTSLWTAAALLQDSQRHLQMGLRRYRSLLVLDLLTLAVTLGLLTIADSAVEIALGVAFGMSVSAAAGIVMARGLVPVRVLEGVAQWWRTMRSTAGPLVVDGVIYTIATQSLVWVLAIRASVPEVGIYRVALMLAFPMTILQSGLSNILLQRLSAEQGRRLSVLGRRMAGRLALVSVGVAFASLLMLPVLNRVLLSSPSVSVALACLVLANAVLVITAEPLSRAAVVQGRVLAMATSRAIAGAAALSLCLATGLGLTASGTAAAILIGQLLLTTASWAIVRRV